MERSEALVKATFEVRQQVEFSWERRGLLLCAPGEVEALRDLLHRQETVVKQAVDMSQGRMPDQHRRDMQALLVAMGFLDARYVRTDEDPH